MKIYNKKLDKVYDEVVLYFTDNELKELSVELSKLVNDGNYSVNFTGSDIDGNLTKKLKVNIYNESNLELFNERIKEVIKTNK